jgi:hypothetical protein
VRTEITKIMDYLPGPQNGVTLLSAVSELPGP